MTAGVVYRCDAATFTGTTAPHHEVRWLDPGVDGELFVEFCQRRGEEASVGDLHVRAREGFTYAAAIEHGRVVARAARWTCAPASWDLAAVATLEDRRRAGLARSVCSFVTQAIVGAGCVATCHTDEGNLPMRRLAESLGFELVA